MVHGFKTALVLTVTVLFSFSIFALAAERMSTRIVEVRAFKNGFSFVVEEGEPKVSGGWVEIRDLPRSAHGSLFMEKGSHRVERILTYEYEQEVESYPARMSELLYSVEGREVTVDTRQGERISGVVVHAPRPGKAPSSKTPQPMRPWYRPYYYQDRRAGGEDTSLPGDMLVLRTKSGVTALHCRDISRLSLVGDDVPEWGGKIKKAGMKLKLNGKGEGPVSFSYLSEGISWVPAYKVDLVKDDKARVIFTAALINDLADLADVDVKLITGYPNMKYGLVSSPLHPDISLQEFMKDIYNLDHLFSRKYGYYAGYGSRAVAYQNVLTQSTPFGRISGTRADEDGSPWSSEGELFFYTIPRVSLEKGERMMDTVMNEKVDCEKVYLWNVADNFKKHRYYYGHYSRQSSRKQEDISDVWHAIRLSNDTGMPWTTAPATVFEDGKALGQDVLDYTAAGQEREVYINRAVGVMATNKEYEKDRDDDSVVVNGRRYTRAYIKGELMVENLKEEQIKIIITKKLSGEVEDLSHHGEHHTLAYKPLSVNPVQELKWELKVGPGKEEKISYNFSLLLR